MKFIVLRIVYLWFCLWVFIIIVLVVMSRIVKIMVILIEFISSEMFFYMVVKEVLKVCFVLVLVGVGEFWNWLLIVLVIVVVVLVLVIWRMYYLVILGCLICLFRYC